ncbi:MAG: class C sortase [Tyzzerella sp.]|nr:class C sortase [Tyzzerella sp.]
MNKIFFAIGILCFLVPFGLQAIDGEEQKHVIETYETELKLCGMEEIAACMENAEKYNQKLYELQTAAVGTAPEYADFDMDYKAQLSLSDTGVMGHVQIPKLDLKLPLYHGTDKEILANGVGHLEGSSLPIGGINSHSVLTGHRGLPSAELFTRLDEMEQGDTFFLLVCNQTMAYQVVRIRVVKPEDVSAIKIEADKDLVSLVTCTPYGINTHRLIVTGERIELEDEAIEAIKLEESPEKETTYWLLIPIVILVVIVIVIVRKRCR